MSAATQSSGGALSGAKPPNNAPNDNSIPNDAERSTPIIREQLPPFPASQHPERGDIDQSPDVALLATYGVRVRDFAYGNTLPPVTTVPRFSVQTQPKLRMLRRTRDMLDGHADGEESDVENPLIHRTWYIDSSGTGTSRKSRYRKKTQALARTLTEPAEEVPPSQGLNTREAGFAVLPSQRAGPPPSQLLHGVQYPATPQRPHRQAKTASLSPLTIADNVSPSQRTNQQGESQETESWIDTPLVTPNGSLQWPTVQNTSAVPTSELESVLPQLPPDQDVTLSQLGFSPERSQQPQPHRASPPFAPSPSPAGTPSRPRRDPHLPPPTEFRARTPSPSKR
ncbi:hypothetical protein BD413DRAFT_692683, partial [Trametes elegans]